MAERFRPCFKHRRLGTLALGLASVAATSAQDAPQAASAAVTAAATHPARWSLSLPATDPLVFKGIANHDDAGIGAAPMLYPAPSLAGALVAVLAHAAIAESAKSAQKAQLQRSADVVLGPYQPVLSTLTHADLLRRLPLPPASETGQTAWRVESKPVFSLTSDGRALLLENEVSVYKIGTAPAASYQSIVSVVSGPVKEVDPLNFWSADEGKRLRIETASLLHESVELAVAAANGTLPPATEGHKTYRYMEGSTEKVERAEVLTSRCGRVVLRTLRSTLLSVPGDPGTEPCTARL
ncbi:MAG TPA: hypothetical protein VLJ19_05295 [Variovorax sp.]|nr:hypothetical protein [Variovorax sp.]